MLSLTFYLAIQKSLVKEKHMEQKLIQSEEKLKESNYLLRGLDLQDCRQIDNGEM